MQDKDKEKILRDLKSENPTWGNRKLSAASGVSKSTVLRFLKTLKRESRVDGAKEGYFVKGRSTLYDENGDVKLEWVKTSIDQEQSLELISLAVEDLADTCRGKSKSIESPKYTNKDLLVCYPIADVHMGMFSWRHETGTDWDSKKCEKALLCGMKYLVDAAPQAETCLIPNLADFFHTDNNRNRTESGGNALDVDTRRAKIFITGVRSYREMIELALSKHKKVVVRSGIGNHDDHSILALAVTMRAYFENNPRVDIELPINPFSFHEFGKNLIGIHHGNLKPDRFPGIMATDEPEAWGRTKHRHFLTGHIHHKTQQEFPGCLVESFRSVASKDYWTHSMGYRAERDMQLIVYHREHGEASRTRIGVESLI